MLAREVEHRRPGGGGGGALNHVTAAEGRRLTRLLNLALSEPHLCKTRHSSTAQPLLSMQSDLFIRT